MPQRKWSLSYAVALLVLVSAGYFCAENFSGRLPDAVVGFGSGLTFPGRLMVIAFQGNMHARFGDWRDPLVNISASYFFWTIPLLLVLRRIGKKAAAANQPKNVEG